MGRGTPTVVDPALRALFDGRVLLRRGPARRAKALGDADRLPFKDALTVNGKTLWENVKDAPLYNDDVIRPLDNPLTADGGICVLRGDLAPNGAVLKPSAATAELMQHRGRAVVFEDFDDYKARMQ